MELPKGVRKNTTSGGKRSRSSVGWPEGNQPWLAKMGYCRCSNSMAFFLGDRPPGFPSTECFSSAVDVGFPFLPATLSRCCQLFPGSPWRCSGYLEHHPTDCSWVITLLFSTPLSGLSRKKKDFGKTMVLNSRTRSMHPFHLAFFAPPTYLSCTRWDSHPWLDAKGKLPCLCALKSEVYAYTIRGFLEEGTITSFHKIDMLNANLRCLGVPHLCEPPFVVSMKLKKLLWFSDSLSLNKNIVSSPWFSHSRMLQTPLNNRNSGVLPWFPHVRDIAIFYQAEGLPPTWKQMCSTSSSISRRSNGLSWEPTKSERYFFGKTRGRFQKWGTPKNRWMVYFRENPNLKWMRTGVPHHDSGNPHKWVWVKIKDQDHRFRRWFTSSINHPTVSISNLPYADPFQQCFIVANVVRIEAYLSLCFLGLYTIVIP